VDEPGSQPGNFKDYLNPESLKVLKGCWIEPAAAALKADDRIQLERLGYFSVDRDSTSGTLVLNRTVGLRDAWAKAQAK